MEELEAPPTSSTLSSQRGRSHHGNGHITTKPVNADGLRSFTLDDQEDDSEDEVLSVPGVRVLKPPGASRDSAAHRSVFLQVSPTSCISCDGCSAPCGGCRYCSAAVSYRVFLIIGNHPSLAFRRKATRTWSGFWRSRTERRAVNSVSPPSPTATAWQPTGNERRTTVTRTSSGCDVTLSSLSSPSNPNSSLSECVRQSSNNETPTVKSSSSFLGFSFFFFLEGGLVWRIAPLPDPCRLSLVARLLYLLIADYLKCSSGKFLLVV